MCPWSVIMLFDLVCYYSKHVVLNQILFSTDYVLNKKKINQSNESQILRAGCGRRPSSSGCKLHFNYTINKANLSLFSKALMNSISCNKALMNGVSCFSCVTQSKAPLGSQATAVDISWCQGLQDKKNIKINYRIVQNINKQYKLAMLIKFDTSVAYSLSWTED